MAFLRGTGERHGFHVDRVDLVRRGECTCSSTEVRRCLAEGDLAGAYELLGRVDPRLGRLPWPTTSAS